MLSTFGGLYRNEQLLRLSELRLPFRLLADSFRFQMALSASSYDCFKLCRSVSPLSTAKFVAAENYYMLETCDGKFLSVTELEKHEDEDEFTPIEFTVCDTNSELLVHLVATTRRTCRNPAIVRTQWEVH